MLLFVLVICFCFPNVRCNHASLSFPELSLATWQYGEKSYIMWAAITSLLVLTVGKL